MIKLFVSDLDGTLLNSNHSISETTKKALLALKDANIQLMFASGRNYKQMLVPFKDFDCTFHAITVNGADIRDEKGNVLLTRRLEENSCKKIYEIAEKTSSIREYYCEKDNYVQVPFDIIDDVYAKNFANMFEFTYEEGLQFVKELDVKNCMTYETDMDKIHASHPLKIEFHPDTLEERNNILSMLENVEDIRLSSSNKLNIEIMNMSAGKGNLLLEYCEKFGYTKEEVAVIGDNFNDVSMLSLFPNAYVMKNAPKEVKKLACYVTDSNDEDGVAKVIYKIIEENKKNSE